ncbi:MAG: PilZ domain-containing protein [bacterium]
MTTKDGKLEHSPQRRYRRREVSLRARFSADGAQYHLGVATSLSADGAFVQTDVLFQMNTRVILEVPLGAELGEARAVVRIVYLNRRSGTEVVHGFGAQLVDPPDELRQRIERFIDDYSAPAAITRDGQLEWPFGKEPPPAAGEDRSLEWLEADETGEAWHSST